MRRTSEPSQYQNGRLVPSALVLEKVGRFVLGKKSSVFAMGGYLLHWYGLRLGFLSRVL